MSRNRRPYKRPVEFKIMCPECGDEMHHKCNDSTGSELRQAFLKFLTWTPEFGLYPEVQKAMQKAGEKEGWLDKGQDFTKAAFFGTQPWTYAMGSKHFSRDFSGAIDSLILKAGFDPRELRDSAYALTEKSEAETKAREENRAKRKAEERGAIKLFQSNASLEKKTVVLDKIIAERTLHHNPMERENTEKNQIEDDFMTEALRHLEDHYEGGISPTVNKLRIEAARKIALDTGIFSIGLYAADGVSVFSRHFKTREEITEFMEKTYARYNALDKSAFARAVWVRVKKRGSWEPETFARGPKGWISAPKTERPSEG